MIPTNLSISRCETILWEMYVATFPEEAQFLAADTVRGHEFQKRMAELRRLQHEASTTAKVSTTATVFDLDEERARRLRDEGMSCWHPTDPEAA
jgi:hypothetical protein